MQYNLSQYDKQFLFTKKVNQGATREEADFEIRKLCLHIKITIDKLKKKKKSPEEINKIFLEELEKFRYM